MKECIVCLKTKEYSEFAESRDKCRKCRSIENRNRLRTMDGVIKRIYASQKTHSKDRGHIPPLYSLKELTLYMMNSNKYIELYHNWARSEYNKELKPSIDRLDDSLGYSFDNIRKSTSGKVAVYSTLLSISHLLIESSAVFLIIYAYGIETVFILDIIPMYCTSILLGFISFLPLGLGVVEGAFSAFLNLRGIELAVALPLVIIIRLITNWFGILLGAFTLKKYGGLTST